MANRHKKPAPIDRLTVAMYRCAVARGEAQWTNGYRTGVFGSNPAEADRLHAKQQALWENVEVEHARFRRLAQRLLREARDGE